MAYPEPPTFAISRSKQLADSEAALKAEKRTLVDLVADIAFENYLLRQAYRRELLERIHGDAALARYQRARARETQPPTASRSV